MANPVIVPPKNDPTPSPPVTEADIISIYSELLGRAPENQGAIDGRLGRTYDEVYREIYGSAEAQQLREASGHDPARNIPTDKTILPPPKKSTGGSGGGASNAVGDAVTQIGSDLANAILQKALDALAQVSAVKDDVTKQIHEQVNNLVPAIGKVYDSITKQIDDITKGIVPTTLSLLGSALGGVENLVSTFLANAADVGDVGDTVANVIKDHQDGIFEFLTTVLTHGISGAVTHVFTQGADPNAPSVPVFGWIEDKVREHLADIERNIGA